MVFIEIIVKMPKQQSKPQSERPSPIPMDAIKLMNRMLRRAVGTINQKINQLEIQLTSPSHSVQDEIQPIAASSTAEPKICYIAPSTGIEKPKFPGNKKIHPVSFVEDLTTWLHKIPNNEKEVELIIDCLEGETRNWARIYKDRWSNLNDFKRDFLNYYWGETEQNELRRKIVHNTWNKTEQPTMLGHFISLMAQAKMLNHPIPEEQLIGDIMRHFPKIVQYSWLQQTGTILEATEFLRNLDNINKQENLKEKSNQGTSTINRQQDFRRPFNKPHRKENTPGINVVEDISDSAENVTVNQDLN